MPVRPTEPAARVALRAAIVAVALAAPIVPRPVMAAPHPAAASRDAAELAQARAALARLPLADRVSQLITTSVPGASIAPRDARVLRAARFGGVIVFSGNYRSMPQLRRFTHAVQLLTLDGDATRPRSLISVDQEGGAVRRIPGIAPTRSAPQLGAANRPALTRAQGRATGEALRALGIGLDLAPVADLDLGPHHVMRARSFGASPRLVSENVAQFTIGLHEGGVGGTLKHFPGFGGAVVNSDDALARIDRSVEQLADDRAPFVTANTWRADVIMMSHGVYTAYDRRRPASASPIAYRLLRSRQTMQYGGVAMTDSLHAAGFRAATGLSAPQGCVATVAAGADIALLTGPVADAVACRRLLLAGVASGAVTRSRIDEAALRVLTLKAHLGLLPAAGVSQPASAG